MGNKQSQRAEETKKAILSAAGKLFANKGYDAVSMREIAKQAKCSHTTIYIYFKDKESLLHQLSMPSLTKLKQTMNKIAEANSLPPEEKLKEISNQFIQFCLHNKNLYTIFINAKSARVDEQKPELEINQIRLEIFSIMKNLLGECLSLPNNDYLLAYSRIFFYNLYGILSTYSYQHEPTEVLFERLIPTFELSVEILISGFRANLKLGVEK
ncbi:TetR/AcrR family transcriptional regulator [Oceanobacillus chungangensis]|uniref:TetR/AcrR family transcriptional regulator n=1 Tax=Oceanobacillus chungangensis TaxID=1229152 RepID=A0A3D8PKY9_9BACI|nr:TetR/AcrR family transcriptional regulator [Oceanobacillus chungangensis]RDW15891.1 TetR/AcrR family transcriptional regulator [Oceanobacillus chungangensis]